MTNRRSLNESKAENRGDVVFSSTSPLVNDNKDHFPINNLNQARNAIARVNQYDKIPDWYNGKSLKQLIDKVNKDVHEKYPSIKISDLNESDSEQHLNNVDKMYDTLLEFLGPKNLLNSLIKYFPSDSIIEAFKYIASAYDIDLEYEEKFNNDFNSIIYNLKEYDELSELSVEQIEEIFDIVFNGEDDESILSDLTTYLNDNDIDWVTPDKILKYVKIEIDNNSYLFDDN